VGGAITSVRGKAPVLSRASVAVLGLVAILAGCGSSGGSSGPVTLNFFIFNEPSGAYAKAADRCNAQANGQYNIVFQFLPAQADAQREQLVRRLAAKDDSIDLIGMDVIWTAEFANAGWIRPFGKSLASEVTKDVFPSSVKTATYRGRLYGAPYTSNTQLLWYRKDLVKTPPTTWAQMIRDAEKLGKKGKPDTIQVQANKYEGYTVWVNSMIASAGGEILSGPNTVALPRNPTEQGLKAIGQLAASSASATNISTSTEDTARLGFEAGESAFMVNYPFVYPSAKADAPAIFKNMGFARYPRVVPGKPSRPPLGGINLGVSAYSTHPQEAFAAVKCLRQPSNQVIAAKLGGLPPTDEKIYSTKPVQDAYPGFANLIKSSINAAAPRPQTPAYQDVSLAIQDSLQPPSSIDPSDPSSSYDTLKGDLQDAVDRKGLF
jgi:multiple sugar transport system substrate-binding protein